MSDPMGPREPLAPLDPRLLELLRAPEAAPSGARERVRDRLAVSLTESVGRPRARTGSAPAAPGGGRFLGMGVRTAVAAAFVAGGMTGAAIVAGMRQAAPTRMVYVDPGRPAVQEPTSPGATAAPAPLELPEPLAPESPVLSPSGDLAGPHGGALRALNGAPGARPTASGAAGAPSRTPGFAEEIRLLDDARAALVQGDAARALERLDEHESRFPDGLLAEERDAMQVQALVRAGRFDEARARAARFRSRSPGSLFLSTVDSAIESIR